MTYFSEDIIVGKNAIDANSHVNNVMYVQWMQDIALSHSKKIGDTTKKQKQEGYMWVAKSHTIEYIAQAYENECLHVKTWVERYKRSACLRKYEFFNAKQTLLVHAETIYVCMNATTLRPMKIPENIYALYVG